VPRVRARQRRPDGDPDLGSADAALWGARERLTPGRRRGWLLHFNAARQAKTCVARIKRAASRILAGLGPHERKS